MRRFTFLISAMLLVGLLMAPASAATLYFDFGDSAQPTAGNYNNIIVNNNPQPINLANAIDSTGAATGIGLTADGFYPGSNQNGTTAPVGAAGIFDPQATRDNAFGHVGPFGGNDDASLATLDFTGLDPSMPYTFTFFASRTGVSDNREAEYAVTGANASTVYLDAANNISNVAVASGIFSTGTGTVQIVVQPGANNNNGSKFYYLGALELTCVPEPISGMLLLFGVTCLVTCRGICTARTRS